MLGHLAPNIPQKQPILAPPSMNQAPLNQACIIQTPHFQGKSNDRERNGDFRVGGNLSVPRNQTVEEQSYNSPSYAENLEVALGSRCKLLLLVFPLLLWPLAAPCDEPKALLSPCPKSTPRLTSPELMELLVSRTPVLPPLMERLSLHGKVIVSICVGNEGRVQSVTAISSHPMAYGAVIESVKNWRFKPYRAGGKSEAVVAELEVDYDFRSPTPNGQNQQSTTTALPKASSGCVTVHGRARFYSGDGQLRIWHIGTHHEYEPDESSSDLVMNWLEEGVKESERANYVSPASAVDLFADFEVCPIELLRKGAVQHARVTKASHRHYVARD
jgi:hypothetical protein